MTAVRHLAAVTGSVVLAVSGLTALTATSATAAGSCLKAQTKEVTGAKITYSRCVNGDGETLVRGTLYDTNTNDRKAAYAAIKIGSWTSPTLGTPSSETYSTGWRKSGTVSVAVWAAG
ncbi:hypothetical protein ACIQ6R_26655 [Streptomyces sp. NPDC096048]|uniref:hypothetical protein n=1 Tax=Streptomyces sp. NPDC096048 TaxID=3366072 RepID=UPI0037FC9B4E